MCHALSMYRKLGFNVIHHVCTEQTVTLMPVYRRPLPDLSPTTEPESEAWYTLPILMCNIVRQMTKSDKY